jgi:hypothetical protein
MNFKNSTGTKSGHMRDNIKRIKQLQAKPELMSISNNVLLTVKHIETIHWVNKKKVMELQWLQMV